MSRSQHLPRAVTAQKSMAAATRAQPSGANPTASRPPHGGADPGCKPPFAAPQRALKIPMPLSPRPGDCFAVFNVAAKPAYDPWTPRNSKQADAPLNAHEPSAQRLPSAIGYKKSRALDMTKDVRSRTLFDVPELRCLLLVKGAIRAALSQVSADRGHDKCSRTRAY